MIRLSTVSKPRVGVGERARSPRLLARSVDSFESLDERFGEERRHAAGVQEDDRLVGADLAVATWWISAAIAFEV